MPYPSPADEPDALDALLAPLYLVVILATVALAALVWLFDRVRGAVLRLRAAFRRWNGTVRFSKRLGA